MPDNDEEVLEPSEQQLSPDVQAKLRIARKAEREAAAAKAELADFKKQTAIAQSGLPDHPARELVFKDYDGPLEPEAIRTYGEKMGITSVPATSTGGLTPEEQEAQRRILNASGGASVGSSDIDLAVALRNAKSQDEVMAIVGEVAGQPGFKNRDGLIGVMPEFG
jgi:hypothetical protein